MNKIFYKMENSKLQKTFADSINMQAANRLRWKGMFLRNNPNYVGDLSGHLLFCYKMAKMFNLNENIAAALFMHDFCEFRYGDVDVLAVDKARINLCELIALDCKANPDLLKNYLIKKKKISDFFDENKIIETSKTLEVFEEYGIIDKNNKNFIDLAFEVKELQDRQGQDFIFRKIVLYTKENPKNPQNETILSALQLLKSNNPLVEFMEKVETGTAFLLENRSIGIRNILKTDFERKIDYTFNKLKKCTEIYKDNKDLLVKLISIQSFMMRNIYKKTKEELSNDEKKLKELEFQYIKKEKELEEFFGNNVFEEIKTIYPLIEYKMKSFVEYKEKIKDFEVRDQFCQISKQFFNYQGRPINFDSDSEGYFYKFEDELDEQLKLKKKLTNYLEPKKPQINADSVNTEKSFCKRLLLKRSKKNFFSSIEIERA